MHISEIEHSVLGLVSALVEVEVYALAHVSGFGDLFVELRQHSAGSDLVAARNGDEHIAVLLGGGHLIDTSGVGGNDLNSV